MQCLKQPLALVVFQPTSTFVLPKSVLVCQIYYTFHREKINNLQNVISTKNGQMADQFLALISTTAFVLTFSGQYTGYLKGGF